MTATTRTLPRLFRALLSLYPPGYRHQVGEEVLETHLDRLAEARNRGRYWAFATGARIVGDLLSGLPIEWGSLVQARFPRDLRVALRALGAHPGYSSVIVLTLALGIGANTAVFSLIDAVVLRPVPVADQNQLVAIYSASPRSPNDGVAYPTYRTLASGSRLLSGLAASMTRDASMDLGRRSETASVVVTSGNYFTVLGLRPQVGRLLEPSDEGAPLANPVAVLSDALWDRLYERRPSAMGSKLRLGDVTFTVVGVAPRGFHGTDLAVRQDVWVPVTMIQGLAFGGMFSGRFGGTILTTFNRLGWLQLIGRMRAGATPELVSAEIGALISASATRGSPPPGQVRAVPLADAATIGSRDGIVTFTRLLGCVVGLMLVLACANVASLLGVRAAAREREVGVSVALGASRARIMGQMLLESALLAGAGGVLGVAVGRLFMTALSAFALPGGIDIDTLGLSLEPRVLAFALALSAATTMLCGLWPAARASRVDPIAALRSQLRSGWTREPRGASGRDHGGHRGGGRAFRPEPSGWPGH
jgi:putative ABC transport system permease protein